MPTSFHSHYLEPPSSFSVFLRGRCQPRNCSGHRRPRLGVPLDTTFTSRVHCRKAAIQKKAIVFTVRRSFCELSKTAFIPLYCAVVRPHREYALRADINQLKRKGFDSSTCFLWNTGASELTSSWPITFSRTDLNESDFFLHQP